MAKKQTSKRAATSASKVLRDKRTSKDSKTAAGSALSQREKRAHSITSHIPPKRSIKSSSAGRIKKGK